MKELVVFAQGDGVTINGLITPDGSKVNNSNVVDVKYTLSPVSEGSSEYWDRQAKNATIDTGLVGVISTYSGGFKEGSYKIDVKNPVTLEVYYKPDVEIMAFLRDTEGVEVPYTDGVRAGKYDLEFGFVRPGTSDRLPDSRLLKDVNYSAEIYHNGTNTGGVYRAGDSVVLQVGDYRIEAQADYMKYNSVSTSMDFAVYEDKDLLITISASPGYEIKEDATLSGFDQPVVAHVTVDGQELTKEQWENINDFSSF